MRTETTTHIPEDAHVGVSIGQSSGLPLVCISEPKSYGSRAFMFMPRPVLEKLVAAAQKAMAEADKIAAALAAEDAK